MRKLFLLLLPAILLMSCNKGKADFVLKGTVTDNTFNTGLSGASIQLYEVSAGGGSTSLLATSTVSSDGSYSFVFARNQAESYIIAIKKANYYPIDATISFSDLSIEDDNVRNFATTAKSWARLVFTTTNSNATLKYNKTAGKDDCIDCCGSGDQFLYGAVDTAIICPNDGNSTYAYNYWVLGTSNNGMKQATTTAFDTVDIVLNY